MVIFEELSRAAHLTRVVSSRHSYVNFSKQASKGIARGRLENFHATTVINLNVEKRDERAHYAPRTCRVRTFKVCIIIHKRKTSGTTITPIFSEYIRIHICTRVGIKKFKIVRNLMTAHCIV